jgi:ABC-type branched-subunit amino acid transport system permease subunit
MANKQSLFDALLVSSIALVVVRHLGAQPAFPGEFVVEDSILLLALASVFAPYRLKPLIRFVIACSICLTMALIGGTKGALKFPSMMFASLAVYTAVLALLEFSKLRKSGPRRAGKDDT